MGNIISKLPELYNAEKQVYMENDMKNKECMDQNIIILSGIDLKKWIVEKNNILEIYVDIFVENLAKFMFLLSKK